ncbi:MAG TPA: family 43 glycosylhydrolase [Pilimelia sp.]|nr:family 43 glycosylhydrolase [Pilimelia sp.]
MNLSGPPLNRRQLGLLAAAGASGAVLPVLAPDPARAAAPPAGSWGDQGNGTYVNPIIPADLSDWDCIRVGTDYYGITSTFGYAPGMAVLHSTDLVNWRTVGNAVTDLTRIGPALDWTQMNRYGRGVWAGAIRHHAGRYWVYFNTPDEGFFMTTATNPAGPWEPVHALWRVSGWNDVCPFWDDDGQPYLVTTNFADGYRVHLFRLAADGRSLIQSSDTVIHQSSGSEANKLYRINGYYYHLYSETKSEGRVVMMHRGRSLYGPYETRQLQHVNKSADREPNQGGLVQTPGGAWYWVTHPGTGGHWEGRVLSLLPVTWVAGWPVIGAVGADGIGTMVWEGRVPTGGGGLPLDALPGVVTGDDFTTGTLKPQWEWHYQPRAALWSLTERPGFLRLRAFAPLATNVITKAGNTLTQRTLRTVRTTVTVKVDLAGLADGQHAGLCHYAATYAGLGVSRSAGVTTITLNVNGRLSYGARVTQSALWLRSGWDVNGVSRFSYSLDGTAFTEFGGTYQLTWGGYRGDRVGIFTYNPANTGYLDVDTVRYTVEPARTYAISNANSGKVADVTGGSSADGAPVVQWRDTGGTNQRWAFQSTGDGYHTITCARSGKALDVAGGSTADNAAVVQSAADGRTSQQWQLRPVAGAAGRFTVVNRRSGRALDVGGGAATDGAAIVQYRETGAANQQWTFRLA